MTQPMPASVQLAPIIMAFVKITKIGRWSIVERHVTIAQVGKQRLTLIMFDCVIIRLHKTLYKLIEIQVEINVFLMHLRNVIIWYVLVLVHGLGDLSSLLFVWRVYVSTAFLLICQICPCVFLLKIQVLTHLWGLLLCFYHKDCFFIKQNAFYTLLNDRTYKYQIR